MSKNTVVLQVNNLKDGRGYMALEMDVDSKEKYWKEYDNQGYDKEGFDSYGLNKLRFDRYGVSADPDIIGGTPDDNQA